MPITSSGFQSRRFPDIKEGIRVALEGELGTSVRSSPDTVMGSIISVFGGEIASQEALVQAQFNQLNIDRAEGIYLDRLVAYIGITRLPASPASGQLLVWRNSEGVTLNAVLFEDNNGVQYSAVNGLNHSLTACSEVFIEPQFSDPNTTYTVVINGASYSYTTGATPTLQEISQALVDEINLVGEANAVQEGSGLRISSIDDGQNDLNINYNQFVLEEIATYNYVESTTTGNIVVEPNTITTIVTVNASLLRCNNPLDFVNGSAVESDEQLRARHERSVEVAGNATVPAIRGTLLNLLNVRSVSIIENTSINEVDGRPPKSYECIVEGGNPNDIATAIWNTKPAGVETFGSITSQVLDFGSELQTVKWSRPEPIYVHVRVTYSLYDEETFPDNGEQLIADAVLAYESELTIGKDVIPTRFIGGIYRAVEGIGDILIEVGTSTSPTATEPDGAWSTATIAIAGSEYASLAANRIDVVQS